MEYKVVAKFAIYYNGKTKVFLPDETCTSEDLQAHEVDIIKAGCIVPIEKEPEEPK